MLLSTVGIDAEYEVLGLVKGSRARTRHVGMDILAGLRKLVGGEIREYASLMEETRDAAIGAMVDEAKKLGANAVIGIRFASNAITPGAAEIIAYGTAVRIRT